MSFATGSALVWLAPLAGAIVLLYLLKMRRKDFVVPATFLWPAMTYEVRANSLFQRLRLSALLFLQLLALVLVVMALARPQSRERGLAGEVTVMVLDTSASMQAREGSQTRMEQAMALCRGVIDSARAGDRVALIEAGPTPRVVFSLSSEPGRMRAALAGVRATDAEVDVGEALRLAASIAAKRSRARIVLVSDGVFPPVSDFTPGKAALEFVPVGRATENVGVTALAAAPSGSGRSVFCAVRNFGKKPATVALQMLADGKVFNAKTLVLSPGQVLGETFEAPPKAEVLEARIDNGGALAADDARVALADPGATMRVLLVGRGDLFLERALALDARVVLDRATAVPSTALPGSTGPAYDVVVFDGVPEVPVRAQGVLTLGAAGKPSPVRKLGNVTSPRLRSAEGAHPLLEAVDLTGTYIERAERVSAKPEGRVLAEGSAGPLVVVSEGAQKHIYVAFAPLDSDFPLQVAFPIFLANALEFLAPRTARGDALAILAGHTFAVPAADPSGRLTLEGPGGTKREMAATGGVFVVRAAVRAGAYTLDSGDASRKLFVNFANERESAIAPAKQVLAGGTPASGSDSILRLADHWRWFALFALAVLAGEWWLFARRS